MADGNKEFEVRELGLRVSNDWWENKPQGNEESISGCFEKL